MEGEEEEEEEEEPSILKIWIINIFIFPWNHIFPVGEINAIFFKIFNIIISVHIFDMRFFPTIMEGEEEEELSIYLKFELLFNFFPWNHIFPVGEINAIFFLKIFNIIISVHICDMRFQPFRHHLGPQNTPKQFCFTWEWYLTCIYTFLNQFWLIWMTV